MHPASRDAMVEHFDGLTRQQLDDLESQFENLQVLWERSHEALHSEEGHHTHWPAIEVHVSEIANTFQSIIQSGVAMRQIRSTTDIRDIAWDFIKDAIFFGMEIGKMNWPITSYKCEQAHKG